MKRFATPLECLAVIAFLGLAACDKPGTDAQDKANKAQSEANREIGQAQAKANEDIGQAKAAADKKINEAQAEANQKTAEAQRDFAKTREDYRHKMQGDIDSLDKKLADLDVKAKKATGKAKAETEAAVLGLRSKREAFGTKWKGLDTATAATWDSTKEGVEKSWNELKAAVDKAT